MNDKPNLEQYAKRLEASGQYRVLRRLMVSPYVNPEKIGPHQIGILIDLETTGLDQDFDEPIELGMLKFAFSIDGRVLGPLSAFEQLREPTIPISDEIQSLTGISNEMVHGRKIDPAEVDGFVTESAVIIAHNAQFDRPMAEKSWPIFGRKAWACSATDLDWKQLGFESAKLTSILAHAGMFYDAHRALDDCWAVFKILESESPKDGKPLLASLLDAARKPKFRIWADGAPFESKDVLKARGYRWNDGSNGRPRAWWIELEETKVSDELAFLEKKVFTHGHSVPIDKITAFNRFVNRKFGETTTKAAD